MCAKMAHDMARNPTFPLYNRMLDGRLTDLLTEWRAGGSSLIDMRDRLAAEYEIRVSPETVGRWCRELGIPTPDRAA